MKKIVTFLLCAPVFVGSLAFRFVQYQVSYHSLILWKRELSENSASKVWAVQVGVMRWKCGKCRVLPSCDDMACRYGFVTYTTGCKQYYSTGQRPNVTCFGSKKSGRFFHIFGFCCSVCRLFGFSFVHYEVSYCSFIFWKRNVQENSVAKVWIELRFGM